MQKKKNISNIDRADIKEADKADILNICKIDTKKKTE